MKTKQIVQVPGQNLQIPLALQIEKDVEIETLAKKKKNTEK